MAVIPVPDVYVADLAGVILRVTVGEPITVTASEKFTVTLMFPDVLVPVEVVVVTDETNGAIVSTLHPSACPTEDIFPATSKARTLA
jgi:hypothetical protein